MFSRGFSDTLPSSWVAYKTCVLMQRGSFISTMVCGFQVNNSFFPTSLAKFIQGPTSLMSYVEGLSTTLQRDQPTNLILKDLTSKISRLCAWCVLKACNLPHLAKTCPCNSPPLALPARTTPKIHYGRYSRSYNGLTFQSSGPRSYETGEAISFQVYFVTRVQHKDFCENRILFVLI